MGISTKKGDNGYTSMLSGERVPKYHILVDAVGSLDEANSFLGLARASSKEKKIIRIILQVQKHLFIIGSELSVSKGKLPKKTISEKDVKWLERLIEDFEESLALPPGFVAFGEEKSASNMDVARTSVRKTERIVVKMKSEDMIENHNILRYLNRLSDLLFILSCFEERKEEEKRKINRALFLSRLFDPTFRKWTILIVSIILALITIIIFILIFHSPSPEVLPKPMKEHMKEI